jgi:hypothetical protein
MPLKDKDERREYDTNRPKNKRRKRDKQRKKEYNKYYEANKRVYTLEEKAKRAKARKLRYQKLRLSILEHYSNDKIKCKCCGENIIEFMCLDHIEGNGNLHRKQVGKNGVLKWIVKNNYPSGFQVLCHNCNMAKGSSGKCPHRQNN